MKMVHMCIYVCPCEPTLHKKEKENTLLVNVSRIPNSYTHAQKYRPL